MATVGDTLPWALSAQIGQITDVYFAELSEEFRNLGWWGSGSTDLWLGKALPLVSEAQTLIAELSDTMMDIELEMLLEGASVSSPVDPATVTGTNIRGVDQETVYARPLGEVWRGIGGGEDVQQAVEQALSRLEEIFSTDNSRVSDLVTRTRMVSEPRVTGYRRVPSGASSCALCLIAATQRYHKANLKGIHPACKCGVVPIIGSVDTQVVDKDTLDRVHSAVAEKYGISDRSARSIDYRNIMVERVHGEMGPMLTWRGQTFTGPTDIASR